MGKHLENSKNIDSSNSLHRSVLIIRRGPSDSRSIGRLRFVGLLFREPYDRPRFHASQQLLQKKIKLDKAFDTNSVIAETNQIILVS